MTTIINNLTLGSLADHLEVAFPKQMQLLLHSQESPPNHALLIYNQYCLKVIGGMP